MMLMDDGDGMMNDEEEGEDGISHTRKTQDAYIKKEGGARACVVTSAAQLHHHRRTAHHHRVPSSFHHHTPSFHHQLSPYPPHDGRCDISQPPSPSNARHERKKNTPLVLWSKVRGGGARSNQRSTKKMYLIIICSFSIMKWRAILLHTRGIILRVSYLARV